MVLKSSSKKKLSIVLVVLFMALILTGVGIGVYFFVKDKSGEKGLTKNQIAFGTTIKNYDRMPSSSLMNFSGVFDGSVHDIVDFSSNYVSYEKDSQTYFVSIQEKQPFVLDLEFDSIVSILDNLAILKSDEKTIVYNLKDKSIVATVNNASISNSFNFAFLRSCSDETFSAVCGKETLNVSSAIVDTISGNVVFKTTLDDDVIDISFGKYFAVATDLSKTRAFSLSENFKEVLNVENRGEVASSDFNIKSSLSEKTFVMIELYRASELSSRALLIEKTSAAVSSDYTISSTFAGQDVFYKVEYNVFDSKTNSYAFIESDNCLIEAADCDFSESYVAVVKTNILNKKNISGKRTIEYYYLKTNEISKNKLQTEKLISYDYDKYGLIVGYNKGQLFTSGGTASSVISFKGEQSSLIKSSAGEKAEGASKDNSFVVFSSVSGLKGVKRASGEVLFNAEFDKISLVSEKNMIAKKSGKYYVLDSEKGISEISSFATEFENYVFSGIGYYFTKLSNGNYNVYKADKTTFKSNAKVKFVEAFGKLKMYVGDSVFSFTLPSGILNNNLAIEKSNIVFGFERNFVGTKTSLAGADNLDVSEINVDSTTGAGFATISKSFSESDLESLVFIDYNNLSSEQKALVPAFDNAVTQSYTLSGASAEENVNFIFDGAYFIANDNVMLAIIRLKNERTNELSFMVNVALKNAYLKELSLSSGSDFVYFDNDGKHNAHITNNKTIAGSALTANVGLYSEDNFATSRTVDYAAAGFDGGMVFVSNDASYIDFKIIVSNIYVSDGEESELYDFNALTNGEVIDQGNYVLTIIKSETEKKIQVSAKNGYAFKGFSAVVTNNSSIVGNSDKTIVSSLSEYAVSVVVDFSAFSENYFKFENISMVEWFARLTLKDFEGSAQEDQTAYYFYGYQDNVSTDRNPAPFGFANFARKTSVKTFAREGYDFNGFDYEKDGNVTRVINGSGKYIASASLLVSDLKATDIVLKANYSAKTYHIKYKNGGTILLEDKAVLFDSEIGTLLTAEEIDIPAGYNFMGWVYNGNIISSDTKYTFARDIIVEAKYEAKTYVLKFDANKDTYFNVNIKGFDYNINKVVFAGDFGGHYSGDEFDGEISKTITFGQKFGALPTLDAFYAVSGANQETYMFVGWFTEKGFAVNGETITRGVQYTENSSVENDPPIGTLYAHYEKSVYRVDLVDSNQDLVENGGVKVPHFEKVRYDGSSRFGTKNSFSTISETGYGVLTKSNDTYNLYIVSDMPLSLQMFVNDGYYISKITVEIYNGSDIAVYNFIGSMSGETYALTGPEIENLTVAHSGKNVNVNLAKILTSKNDNGENLGAKFTVETSAIYFSNSFVLKTENIGVKRGSFNISENGTDVGLIYNGENVYDISLASKTSNVGTLNLAVLKKLKFNATTLEFSQKYEMASDVYFNVISATNYSADSVVRVNGVVLTTYKLNNATFIIKYDVSAKNYSYELSVLQLADNQIEIEAENVSSSVSLNFTNMSTDSAKKQGMNASLESNINGENGSLSNVDSGYSVSGILPTDKIEFTLKLSNYFLMSETALVLNYGDGSYTIYRFTTSSIDTSNRTISQAHSVVAPAMFNKSSSETKMDGTGISLAFNSQTKTFTIVIAGIYKNVSISLQYYSYRFVSIYSDSEQSYSATVQNGSFDQKSLNEIATSNPSDVQKIAETGATNFVIYKNESNISNIKVVSKSTESELYRISVINGNITLSEGDTIASIVIGDTNYRTILSVAKIDRSIKLINYLGTTKTDGKFNYEKDPLSGIGFLANMSVSYYDSIGNLTSYTLQESGGNVYFNGSKLVITFANIKNYTLYSAGLYNLDSGELLTGGLVESVGEDGLHVYTYTIDSIVGDSFEFRTYFDPYSIVVKYDIEGNVSGVASSSVSNSQSDLAKLENQVAYWNVPYPIVNVSLERNGYDFLGYSLEVSDQSQYSLSQIVTNFEIDENKMENGKEIILHAVYSAKTYKISFIRRGNTSRDYACGSTSVVIIGSSIAKVKFDQKLVLSNAYRIGYNFGGWFTGISGTKDNNSVTGSKVSDDTILDDNLFNSLNRDASGNLCLYANWQAINFTIKFNKNDDHESNGSTAAGGSDSPVKVLFDSGKIPSLPTLTRYGYNLSGYKAQKLFAGETNEYSFVEAGNVLNASYLSSCGINIPNQIIPVSEFTVYAVWSAKTFRAILDTQKTTLSGHGDGDPDITLTVTGGYSGIENGKYYVDVKFDSAFKIVPTVSATGYQFNGVYTEPTGGTKIIASTVVNSSFDEVFTVYAQYSKLSYAIYIDKGDLASCSPSGETIQKFYDSLAISMTTSSGYFIQTIVIYNGVETITLTYAWDSENKSMTIQSVTSSKDASLSSLNSRTSLYRNIQTSYQYNTEQKTCAFNLTINGIKNNFRVRVQNTSVQTYSISFYTFAEGSNGQQTYKKKYKIVNFDISAGGLIVCQNDLLQDKQNYPYLPGYKFVEYRYGSLENGVVAPDMTASGEIPVSYDETKIVSENRKIVAVYTDQTRQGVHFYFYNDGAYAERSSNEFMMYWKDGSTWNSNSSKFDIKSFISEDVMNVGGGKILELPSTGSFLWPDGNVLCGFVIASSAPATGYYNLENSKGLKHFDCSTKIEEELKVYAVYDKQYFTVSSSGTTLNSKYSLYQEYNGAYIKVTGDIKYLKMSEADYKNYRDQIARGQTAEVALTMVSTEQVLNCATNGYYVAVIMSDSGVYYKVSDNALKIG